MKLNYAEKKARLKFWLGLIGTLAFGFTTIIAFLKSLYISFREMGGVVQYVSDMAGSLINWIYEKTDFLTFFWNEVWGSLPIFNPLDIWQESNFYFFALFALSLVSFMKIQDSFWIRSRINNAKRKIEDELLEKDIKRQSGSFEVEPRDVLELEINLGKPDPWYRRPLGLISIGLFIAIAAKILGSMFGLDV